MESRFSYLRQPDSSVSMLRVKMSRRRSQSQKENRERALTRLRRLDRLPEMDASALDVSAVSQVAACRQETAPVKKQGRDPNAAVEERKKMLSRYKEAKELQKEKEKRERERKGGVFKVGLYKPQPLAPLSQVSGAPSRTKPLVPASAPASSGRVTRSMKQQPLQKMALPVTQKAVPRKVEPAVVRAPASRINKPTAPSSGRGKATAVEASVRAPATRSASDSQTSTQAASQKPAGPTTRASSKQHMEPPKGRAKPVQGKAKVHSKGQKAAVQDESEKPGTASSHPPAGPARSARADVPPDPPSFAPQGFVFQAPAGVKPFQCVPLTPRSADAFLTPSAASTTLSFLSPVVSRPSIKPASPPPLRRTPSPPAGPQEAQHDVPYFRAVMASETERLSGLCEQWGARTEDSSIPQDIRDGMRTAIGQARLLMKERFGQFGGLVDDCALGRGEKITTCSDLQGFWDMVYFQVEDVMKKFESLKAAESRGWQEEPKLQPRTKRTVKKVAQTAPASKSAGESGANAAGASAAAKSRLAAVKAAMRARRAAAAEGAGAPVDGAAPPEPPAPAVVFHGGFFKVESPAKLPGPLRRSARLVAAASPSPTPAFTTPARSRRSDAVKPSPVCQRLLTLSSPAGTPARRTPHSLSQSSLPQDGTQADAPSAFRSPSGHVTQGGSLQNGCPASPVAGDGKRSSFSDDRLGPDPADGPLQSPRLGSPLPAESETGVEPAQVEEVQGPVTEMGGQADLAAAVGCPLGDPSTKNLERNSSFLHSPPRRANSPLASAHRLSFTLSPAPYESAPVDAGLTALSELSPSSPQPTSCAAPDSTQRPPSPTADVDMSSTPDSSYVEYITGLDFERYLRPPIRSSLSPRRPASAEASPMAVDVNADSPGRQPGEWPVGGALNHMGPTGELRAPGPAFLQPAEVGASHQTGSPRHPDLPSARLSAQLPGSSLLLFTPEQKAKVRQSVCGRDLMMFTPPSSS